jgi:hypothetical protein
MADLVVITPTRGRPARFAELANAIRDTAVLDVDLVGYVDNDDPDRDVYRAMAAGPVHIAVGPRQSLSGWTNAGAHAAINSGARYLASLGDDHLPRTPGWDLRLIEAIEQLPGPGIAYGNDLFQGGALPTAWVVAAELVRAVGWMMLPACEHMYVDTAVLALGQAADRIVYRPDVVIEHRHPLAGKTAWDMSYRESNAESRYAADKAAYDAWCTGGGLEADAATVQALTRLEPAK